jgi:predicted P-loop ATPase
LRAPYGKVSERFQRKAILCGTSNKIDVIQDHDTGNSRIIPLELTSIDQDLYNSILRQELFGELARLYHEMGEEYLRLTPEELKLLQSESGDYTALNVEQELILRFFRPGHDFMTVTEMTDYIMEHTNQQITSKKISRELLKLNFKKDRRRVTESEGNCRHLNGYYVEKIQVIPTFEDIKNSIGQKRMVDDEE